MRLCYLILYLPLRNHGRTRNGGQTQRSYRISSKKFDDASWSMSDFYITPFKTRIPPARTSIGTFHMPALSRNSLLDRLGIPAHIIHSWFCHPDGCLEQQSDLMYSTSVPGQSDGSFWIASTTSIYIERASLH